MSSQNTHIFPVTTMLRISRIPSISDSAYAQAFDLLRAARHVVVLTCVGISTESGIRISAALAAACGLIATPWM